MFNGINPGNLSVFWRWRRERGEKGGRPAPPPRRGAFRSAARPKQRATLPARIFLFRSFRETACSEPRSLHGNGWGRIPRRLSVIPFPGPPRKWAGKAFPCRGQGTGPFAKRTPGCGVRKETSGSMSATIVPSFAPG